MPVSFESYFVEINDDQIDSIIRIFKALSEPTRVRIVSLLTNPKKMSVSDIANALGMEISRVSHQLSKLEDMGFARRTREGRNIYYEIEDECIRTLLRTAKDHVAGR